MLGSVPYRESSEDPRIDVVRRTHTVAEHGEVTRVVKRFEDELERALSAVAAAANRLYRAEQGGTANWLFRTPPDPETIERELRELDSCQETRSVATAALELAKSRERVLAELVEPSPAEAVSTDRAIVNAAVAASVRAAATHGRDVRKVMRETADLVTQAHRAEIAMALTGQAASVHALPLADRAVTLARCRVDLLRANLVSLGTATEAYCTALGEVIATLHAAGTGPGQPWKDKVLAATQQLDDIVTKLERS